MTSETLFRLLRFIVNLEALFVLGMTGVIIAYYWRHPLLRHIAPVSISYSMCVLSLCVGLNRGVMTTTRAIWSTVAITLGLWGIWQLISFRQKRNLATQEDQLRDALSQDVIWREAVAESLQEIIGWIRKRNGPTNGPRTGGGTS